MPSRRPSRQPSGSEELSTPRDRTVQKASTQRPMASEVTPVRSSCLKFWSSLVARRVKWARITS